MSGLDKSDILQSLCHVLIIILKFCAFAGKIEAPLTLVLGPGASIRENTVNNHVLLDDGNRIIIPQGNFKVFNYLSRKFLQFQL